MAEFNLVVCGIATIAATVGYACVRKFRPLPSRSTQHLPDHTTSDATVDANADDRPVPEKYTTLPDWASESTVVTEQVSLKRKRSYDPEEDTDPELGYPENLKSIYPNKRRSGSQEPQEPSGPLVVDIKEEQYLEVDSRLPIADQIITDVKVIEVDIAKRPDVGPSSSVKAQEAHEPTSAAPITVETQVDADSDTFLPGPILPIITKPEDSPTKPVPVFPEFPRFVFPQPPPRIVVPRFPSTASASLGFANFAGGSSSAFVLPSLSSSSDDASGSMKSIWADSAAQPSATSTEAELETAPALTPLKAPAPATQAHVTGEEDESVVLELKGVKLFVKRGEESFSSGMLGHIKLLENHNTKARRLLFRREPLWKVSMNARLGPTLRCTFDERENVLRVALKELGSSPAQIVTVIYAFKPGRACKKSAFQDFAESLLAQTRANQQ